MNPQTPVLLLLLALSASLTSAQIIQQGEATFIAPDTELYRVVAEAAINVGTLTTDDCEDQGVETINDCRLRCLAPEQNARGNCCCSVNSKDQLFVGERGGCAFGHQLAEFEDTFVLESFQEALGGIGATCNQLVARPECVCYQRWDIPRSAVVTPNPTVPDDPPVVTPSIPSPPSGVETPVPVAPAVTPTPIAPVDPAVETPAASPVAVPEGETPVATPVVIEDGATPVATPILPPGETPVSVTPAPGESPEIVDRPLPSGDATPAPTAAVPTVGPAASDEDATPGTSVFEDPSPESSAEEDDGSVCIDEEVLRAAGFDDEHFVHKGGLTANAFCPGNGIPCGTAYHKVRYEGADVSYRMLCEKIECERKVMKVNSVYSHMWSEKVYKDVTVTMFDVRYFEGSQIALHWSMRMARKVVG